MESKIYIENLKNIKFNFPFYLQIQKYSLQCLFKSTNYHSILYPCCVLEKPSTQSQKYIFRYLLHGRRFGSNKIKKINKHSVPFLAFIHKTTISPPTTYTIFNTNNKNAKMLVHTQQQQIYKKVLLQIFYIFKFDFILVQFSLS